MQIDGLTGRRKTRKHREMDTRKQIDRHASRQFWQATFERMDERTNRWIDRKADRQIDRQTYRNTWYTGMGRQIDR